MPAYKTEYLREAIRSILNQTYKDFKLVISDDCSPFDVENVVREFSDTRITFRKNEKNIGGENLVVHWNLLLNYVDTDFVILSPDDDLYSCHFLEEINNLVGKYPEANVFKSRSQDVDALGVPYKQDIVYPQFISQIENIKYQFSNNTISGIGQYVFKRQALVDIGGFVNYPVAWWSDVMTHIKLSGNGMGITKDILFSFRHFEGNISSHKSKPSERKAKTKATLLFFNDMKCILQQCDATKEDCEWIIHQLDNVKLRWIYSCAAVNSLKENIDIIRSNQDIFTSFRKKLYLFRYWLIKDWIIGLIGMIRK